MRHKLPLGAPYEVAFRVLRRMKRLRGTPFDVFGAGRDRRAERALIADYERLIDETTAAGMPYDTLVRGLAYVQNHPRPRPAGEWPYDALNEVWFDDLASLRGRIDWFSRNPPGAASAGHDLFGQSWFLAAREVVLALLPVHPDPYVIQEVGPCAERHHARRRGRSS